MARLQDMAKRRTDLYHLEWHLIQEEPGWNVRAPGRELDAHIRGLCDSIRERGVLEPLTVYLKDGVPTLINGHCRLMAVKLAASEGAEIITVPVRVEEKTYNDADRVLSMITRNQGKPLTPLELAEVVKRLRGYGWSTGDIAKKSGFGDSYIRHLDSLGAAPEQVKTMIRQGGVAPSVAVQVLKREGETKGVEKLQAGVQVARDAGKTRATPKHIDPPEGKAVAAEHLQQAATNWPVWGPRMQRMLERLRDATSPEEVESLRDQIGPFLTSANRRPNAIL